MAGSGNTYKHSVTFAATAENATLVLPAAYDVIQLQIHLTGAPAAGDGFTVRGVDEDGDEVILPGGTVADGSFDLQVVDAVLQFTWKGPKIKLTYTEVTGANALEIKVKTFMENVGDVDNMTAYAVVAAAGGGATRSLKGS